MPVPPQPSVFTGDPSQDVRTWLQSTEIVFLGLGVTSLADKIRMICAFVDGPAAIFLASLPDVDSLEHFKQIRIGYYTLYSTDVRNRLHFHAIRQDTDDVEQYICEFARRLDLVTNPSEQEVLMVFIDGLYEENNNIYLRTWSRPWWTPPSSPGHSIWRTASLSAMLLFRVRCISSGWKTAMSQPCG